MEDTLEFYQDNEEMLDLILNNRKIFKEYLKQEEFDSFSDYIEYWGSRCQKYCRDGKRCEEPIDDESCCQDCDKILKLCEYHLNEGRDFDSPSRSRLPYCNRCN